MAEPKSPGATQTSGFTEEQRAELRALIAEVAGGAKPPTDPKVEAPKVTDDEWSQMSDRQRQTFVSQLVDFRLDELARLDADAARDAKIAALEKKGQSVPEQAPSTWSKLQGWLWGAASEQS